MELIFACGYGCCAFKYSIYGDQLKILDGMLDSANALALKFFVNPRCPPAPTTIEVKAEEVDLGEATKDPAKGVVAREQD